MNNFYKFNTRIELSFKEFYCSLLLFIILIIAIISKIKLKAVRAMLEIIFITLKKNNTPPNIIVINPAISQGLNVNLEFSIILLTCLLPYLISVPFDTFWVGDTKTNLPSESSAISIIPCDFMPLSSFGERLTKTETCLPIISFGS